MGPKGGRVDKGLIIVFAANSVGLRFISLPMART